MNITKLINSNQSFGLLTMNASKRIRKGEYEGIKLPQKIKRLRSNFSKSKDYILDFDNNTSEFRLYSRNYDRVWSEPDYYIDKNNERYVLPVETMLINLSEKLDSMKWFDKKGEGAVKRTRRLTLSDVSGINN